MASTSGAMRIKLWPSVLNVITYIKKHKTIWFSPLCSMTCRRQKTRCFFMTILGTVWTRIVPTWGKHRAPHGQARCPTWASTVPNSCSFCYPCRWLWVGNLKTKTNQRNDCPFMWLAKVLPDSTTAPMILRDTSMILFCKESGKVSLHLTHSADAL